MILNFMIVYFFPSLYIKVLNCDLMETVYFAKQILGLFSEILGNETKMHYSPDSHFEGYIN